MKSFKTEVDDADFDAFALEASFVPCVRAVSGYGAGYGLLVRDGLLGVSCDSWLLASTFAKSIGEGMPDGSTPEMAARANTLSSMRAAMLIFLFLGMEPSSLKILLPFEVAARIITYKMK